MTQTMKPVRSLMELEILAKSDIRYRVVAVAAANNLGGSPDDLASAMKWLRLTASETSESGVVDEVNFLI